MQQSAAKLFVFVEGWTDRSFYDQVCEPICRRTGITVEIRTSEEVSGFGGGKDALIALFRELAALGALFENCEGKTTGAFFFLDKDVDDFSGTLVRSDHLAYTAHYHMENYLYADGNLVHGSVHASGLDKPSVSAAIPDAGGWRRAAADEWRDWVKLCVFSRGFRVPGGPNFGAPISPINRGCYGGLLHGEPESSLVRLKAASALDDAEFERRWRIVSDWVDQQYIEGRHDAVFKGNWYGGFLAATLRRAAGGRRCHGNIGARIGVALAMTLNFDGPWANDLRAPVERLVARL